MASSRNSNTEMVFNFGAKMLSLLRLVPIFCLSFVGLNVKTAPVMSALRHSAHMFGEPNHNHSHFILCSPFQSFTPLLSSL